ncbi:hypothetical protein [Pseudoalteromonas peptidolytica]|uniref:hypothetical protein n=1 Tax=Pseudoalteromonas peptidolytica TaxID=61150 RepID=UPI00298D6A65|nr:hypothetical protein [Pseudoalteromonas peptidolytica]MDW7547734.1 hypothetical protein [Pseudoalteromonas peptidolytica]
MIKSIPYDPTLTLGSVICPLALGYFQELADKKIAIKRAKYKLEAAIESKRNLEKTLVEISSLGLNGSVHSLKSAINLADQKIRAATNQFVSETIDSSTQHDDRELSNIGLNQTSPIDFAKSKIIKLPTAVDSIRVTAQYFPYSEKDSEKVTAQMADFVSKSAHFLGAKRSMDIGAAVQEKIADQQDIFSTQGTLIITATCTHKYESSFSPLIFEPDITLRTWNKLFPDNAISITDKEKLINIATNTNASEESRKLWVCCGASYGSSFVGMVHMLSDKSPMALPAGKQLNGWSDIKKVLASSEKNTLHCSVVTTGALPKLQLHEGGDSMLLNSQSLLATLDDYIDKVEAGDIGVPIKYYLSSLEADQVAQFWCNKHLPNWRSNFTDQFDEQF